MSKIKENNGNAKLQSADKTKDREFEQWVQQQFMAEAAAIEKEIDGIPDSKEFEPTEEKFQKLLQKAREQGSVYSEPDSAQTKVSEDSTTGNTGIITSEKIKSGKLNNEKLNMEPKKTKHTHIGRGKFAGAGEKVVKWAAVAAVTVFGIFGVSMTSEANRAYVMETVNNMTGNNTETEIDNDEVMISGTTEEEAKEQIIDSLQIEMPQFYYWPHGIEYEDYTVDENAQTAIIQYLYRGDVIHFMIISNNNKNASFFVTRDSGEKVKMLTSELMDGVSLDLWKVLDESDKQPTYILQWEYKNVYYELTGKVSETEMENIAKNIMY